MINKSQILLKRLLIYTLVTSFIIGFVLVLENIIGNELDSESLSDYFNWFIYTMLSVSGILYVIALQIFVKEKSKAGVHIRFIFFYVIFELGICFVLKQNCGPYVLIPVSILHYFLEAKLNSMFVIHDLFLTECDNRNGKTLREYLFHNNLTALDLGKTLKNMQLYLFIMSFLNFIIILIPSVLKIKIPVLVYVLSFVCYICIFINFVLIGLFNKDSYFAFLGFNKSIFNKRRMYKICFIMFGISIFAGFVISSNKALINITKFAGKQKEYSMPEIKHEVPETKEYKDVGIDDLEYTFVPDEGKPSVLLTLIYNIIKYGFITGIIASVLVFLFKPFFQKDWREYWKQGRFIKFLRMIISELKEIFRHLFKFDGFDDNVYTIIAAKSFKDSLDGLIRKSNKSKQKKLELDKLTRQFMKVIDWGSKKQVKYTTNLAPAEYTEKLCDYVLQNDAADKEPYCIKAGMLFEKALYDRELLSNSENKEFYSAVSYIITEKK